MTPGTRPGTFQEVQDYALENALSQWQEGEQRVREDPGLEDAVWTVLAELRRRLGSTFSIEELIALYAGGTDWAADVARRRGAGTDGAWVVDAAFGRYAGEAADFAGGRPRPRAQD